MMNKTAIHPRILYAMLLSPEAARQIGPASACGLLRAARQKNGGCATQSLSGQRLRLCETGGDVSDSRHVESLTVRLSMEIGSSAVQAVPLGQVSGPGSGSSRLTSTVGCPKPPELPEA